MRAPKRPKNRISQLNIQNPLPNGRGFCYNGPVMKMKKNGIKAVLFLLLAGTMPFWALADVASDMAARRAKLEAELAEVEKDIAAQNALLKSKQKETASIERDLSILDYKITTAKLNIKAKQIEIQKLSGDITKKQSTIGTLAERLAAEKNSLAELLREWRELDDLSATEVALSNDDMSTLFADLAAFDFVQTALAKSFSDIRQTRASTETEKKGLEVKRDETVDAKVEIEKETAKVQELESQKKDLLKVSKNQESQYKKVLAERQKKKSEILSALFQLRDSGAIPFEKALSYANEVAAGTGVRPAMLLAILTQETNLGENVGSCNRPGDPPSKSWKNIMKPTRDIDPYLRITKSLGLDPNTMPLSCAMAGGYGGAMGPSQFIPSTWELYIKRIAAVTGNNPPNPWNPEDAFAATGLLLKDLGAAAGTYSAERRAALKYYAGGNWDKPQNAFYGDSVMAHAAKIQKNIDYLQSN